MTTFSNAFAAGPQVSCLFLEKMVQRVEKWCFQKDDKVLQMKTLLDVVVVNKKWIWVSTPQWWLRKPKILQWSKRHNVVTFDLSKMPLMIQADMFMSLESTNRTKIENRYFSKKARISRRTPIVLYLCQLLVVLSPEMPIFWSLWTDESKMQISF